MHQEEDTPGYAPVEKVGEGKGRRGGERGGEERGGEERRGEERVEGRKKEGERANVVCQIYIA